MINSIQAQDIEKGYREILLILLINESDQRGEDLFYRFMEVIRLLESK